MEIIKENEDGNKLYIIDEGTLDCLKNGTKIRDYEPGDLFGELALLYNTKRQASIEATSDVRLFSLDRNTFNNIVKYSANDKREKF